MAQTAQPAAAEAPLSPEAATRPRVLRRRRRRRRRWLGALVLLAPTLWIVGTDGLRRFRHLLTFDRLHIYAYLATLAASAVFWAVLLYSASRPRGWLRQPAAGLFVVLYSLAVGVQGGFHHFYNIYLSHDGQIYSRSIPWSLLGHLPLSRPAIAAHLVWALLLALLFVIAARTYVKPRRVVRLIVPVFVPLVLVGMTQIPASYRSWQSTTPDIIYFHGLVSMTRERLRHTNDAPELRVQRRDPEAVPSLTARPARPRNVLFVLQESLRGDEACSEYDPKARCANMASNRVLPKRYPLLQLRANAATTAISISNLWSGVGSQESLDTLLSVPLIWDYAAAAGFNGAYWTSQNVMFGNMRLYVQDFPVTHRAVATQLDTTADYDAGAHDALLSDWVIDVWDTLEEPFMAVVQYSNGHFPYVYDEKHAPFQPSEFSKDADKNQEYRNFYRNVAYLSDLATARLLEHVRASESGKRTVILYTSDHGEAFREHWQLGHTSSLYDEEIKVPGWIDAPAGTLSSAEEASIRNAKDQFVWHYDIPPTILDLMGVWDDPALAPFRARMIGNPITRPQRTLGPVPLSNCSWLWECGFRNWGMMQGPMKIEARQWDSEFHCFNLLADPLERNNLGERACAPLPDLAREMFGLMPVVARPPGEDVLWGPPPPTASAGASGG
jgi:glucan phosphoethanolaminetransferase (alkaline phosphatase superfamily)